MLTKKLRLNKDKEYDKIFKAGKASYSNLLGVKAVKNDLNYSRFGIIVSNKTNKLAVVRNRYKRQLRYIIKKEINNIKDGYDIAIIVQKDISQKSSGDIQTDLIQHLKKLDIIK